MLSEITGVFPDNYMKPKNSNPNRGGLKITTRIKNVLYMLSVPFMASEVIRRFSWELSS